MTTTALPTTARAATWFHALSDPTRINIVEMLSHGERCVCELQSSLDAAQSRLSFHLRVLKDAGLVSDRREGRWSYYTINSQVLDQIADFAQAVKPGEHAGSCRTACC
ncbi:MAG TPA: metalloregulator ArsR/SmtB family transcription factor [Gemmatimonadales bacterium]|nr:metalloregulator ArsR/SmtB family transcription factor [Gemmatimonadales bacterium]